MRDEGPGVNGAVAHRVVAIFELLAGGVVGVGQAVEVVIRVGDDAGGGCVGHVGCDVLRPGQGIGHGSVAHGQGHGVDAGQGVGVGMRHGRGGAGGAVPVGP